MGLEYIYIYLSSKKFGPTLALIRAHLWDSDIAQQLKSDGYHASLGLNINGILKLMNFVGEKLQGQKGYTHIY